LVATTSAAALAFVLTSVANCSADALTLEAASDANSTPCLTFSVTAAAPVTIAC
jgi:hypothetical protein